ncbi:MAG: amino acid permease [Candidatus Omnitrophica bacterium]|nr:amino acid permease [Candidatus Omnitrophota bacterium]
MSNIRNNSLPRVLNLSDAIAIVVGGAIGAGIFRTPSSIARILPYPGLILLAWVAAGVLCFIGALCYAELSALYPKAGGEYAYLRGSFGKGFAFVFGWMMIFVNRAGIIAGIAHVFAGYVTYFFPCPAIVQKSIAASTILILAVLAQKGIALSTIFILSFVNICGVRLGKWLQNILTVGNVLFLAGIAVIGFFSGRGSFNNFLPLFPPSLGGGVASSFGLALIFALWTYSGWNESAYVGEEIKNPGKNIPLSLVLGTSVLIFLYLVVNFLWLWYVPLDKMKQTETVAALMMRDLLGNAGGACISFAILLFVLGSLNSTILTSGRIVYAVARDNKLFSRVAGIHKKFGTPALAIAIDSIWPVVLVLIGSFDQLISFVSVGFWFFVGMTGIALFILRRKYPSRRRPFKVWGYPFTPIIFIAVSFCLALNTVILRPVESLIGIGLILTAIPVYWYSKRLGHRRR